MKRVFATARNIRHSIHGDDIETRIEMILTASEKQYRFSGGGYVGTETLSTHRFEMDIQQAEQVRDDITKWITEAKAEKARLAVRIENKETNDE